VYANNRCILSSGAYYLLINGDISKPPNPPGQYPPQRALLQCLDNTAEAFQAFNDGLVLGNNTVYIPGGVATVKCGDPWNPSSTQITVNTSKFQAMGYDSTTTFTSDMPSNRTIILWARDLLGMQQLTPEIIL